MNDVDTAWVNAAAEELGQTTPDVLVDAAAETSAQPDPTVQAVVEQIKPLLEQYNAQITEQLRRAQQSNRDSNAALLERVEARLAQASVGLQAAVEAGAMSEEEADEIANDLRQQFQAEEANPNPPSVPMWVQETRARIEQIWANSGLTPSDPEVRIVPADVSHLPPFQAVEVVQQAVNFAKQLKAQRLGSTVPSVLVDMGGGSAPQNASVDSLTRALNAELMKPDADEAKINKLSEQLERIINSAQLR